MTRREQHLNELADQLDARLVLVREDFSMTGRPKGWSGAAHQARLASDFGYVTRDVIGADRWAFVSAWDDSERAYFVGLHELGHVALNHNGASRADFEERYLRRQLEAEAEAWQWALENSEEELSADAKSMAASFLSTYESFGGGGPTFTAVAAELGLVPAVWTLVPLETLVER